MVNTKMNTTQKYTVVASSLALIAVMFNVSIVGPALPALQAGLNSSANALAWVVNAYNIVFASLLLAGGLLGDRFGHRWILHVGLLITLLGALLAATAPTVGWLLGARAVQGVGSSLLQPASLALLTYAFPEPKARTRAIGLWGGMSGLGIALGPVLGGLLVDLVSWRAIFVPMMLVGVGAWLVSLRWVVETPTQTNKPLDGWGLLLAVVTLFALSYGLSQGALLGWTSPLILTVFALALVSFALFIVVEKRHSTPLVALAFFALPTYTVANLAGLLASFGDASRVDHLVVPAGLCVFFTHERSIGGAFWPTSARVCRSAVGWDDRSWLFATGPGNRANDVVAPLFCLGIWAGAGNRRPDQRRR